MIFDPLKKYVYIKCEVFFYKHTVVVAYINTINTTFYFNFNQAFKQLGSTLNGNQEKMSINKIRLVFILKKSLLEIKTFLKNRLYCININADQTFVRKKFVKKKFQEFIPPT